MFTQCYFLFSPMAFAAADYSVNKKKKKKNKIR